MSGFYNYDTRGASYASQLINLERMVEKRDEEIGRLRGRADDAIRHLHAVLNKARTSDEQQRADSAAREWLESIGSEVPR